MRSVFVMGINLVIICFLFIGCGIQRSTLSGELVMQNPDEKDRGCMGIMIYKLGSNKVVNILENANYGDPSYNQDKSKILITNEYSIYEYDIRNSKLIIIHTVDKSMPCSNARYVPNSNAISFKQGSKLFLYDIPSKKQMCIAEFIDDYTWSKDGKHVLYGDRGVIKSYDKATEKIASCLDGYGPEYSNKNEYIAYRVGKKSVPDNDILIIREIKTGKEWRYKTRKIYNYKFSPDDRYIAIQQESTNLWYIYGQEMKVWDFKANKVGTLIKHIHTGSYGYFDWK